MIHVGNDIYNIKGDFYFISSSDNKIIYNTSLGNKDITVANLYHCINHVVYNCATNKKLTQIEVSELPDIYVYKSIKINEYKEDALVYLNLTSDYIDGMYINGKLGILKNGNIYTEYLPPIPSNLVNYFSFECINIDEQNRINNTKKIIVSKMNKISKINSFKNCVDAYKRPLLPNDYVLYYNGVLSLGCLTPLGEVITPYGYTDVGIEKNSYYKIDFKFNINDNIIWYNGIYEQYFDKKMVDVLGNQLTIGDFVVIDFNSRNITYGIVISSTQCLLLTGKKVKCSSVCKIASLNNISTLSSDELVIYNKLKELYGKEANYSIKKSVDSKRKELGQVYCSNRGSKYYIYLGKYLCQFRAKTDFYQFVNDYENNIVDLYLIIDLNKQYQVNFYNSLLDNCALEKDFMAFCGLISEKCLSAKVLKLGLGHFDANISKGKMNKELAVVNIPNFMKQINITSPICDAVYTYQGI